jgi:hypothetical protein
MHVSVYSESIISINLSLLEWSVVFDIDDSPHGHLVISSPEFSILVSNNILCILITIFIIYNTTLNCSSIFIIYVDKLAIIKSPHLIPFRVSCSHSEIISVASFVFDTHRIALPVVRFDGLRLLIEEPLVLRIISPWVDQDIACTLAVHNLLSWLLRNDVEWLIDSEAHVGSSGIFLHVFNINNLPSLV